MLEYSVDRMVQDGQRLHVLHLIDPHGWLSRETYDLLDQTLRQQSLMQLGDLNAIGRWAPRYDNHFQPLPMTTEETTDMQAAVHRILAGIRNRQADILHGRENQWVDQRFISQVSRIANETGYANGAALLRDYENLPLKIRSQLCDGVRRPLYRQSYRAEIIGVFETFEQLRDASQALRRESTAMLGEEHLRPVHVQMEQRSSGRTTSQGITPKTNTGWSGGYGCVRPNGHRSFGNDASDFIR